MTELTGRLATWDGHSPELRSWSDAELIDALGQLQITTDKDAFTAAAIASRSQADLEDTWLEQSGVQDEGLRVLVWMSVQELWERWRVPTWPHDRMARMFAYLVDAEFAADWADRCHAPTGAEVIEALATYLAAAGGGREPLDKLVEELGMPSAAWPSKMLDAMGEWVEVGNVPLAERAAEVMANALDEGHPGVFLAASLMTARMYDRARAAALAVPHDANVREGFAEMTGFLCLAAGSGPSARYWLHEAPGRSKPRQSEQTFAAEAARGFVNDEVAVQQPVPEDIRRAALQAASQSCFYATMAFAGIGPS